MATPASDQLSELITKHRAEIERRIVNRAFEQLKAHNPNVGVETLTGLQADIPPGIDALLQWLNDTKIDPHNSFFAQLVEHSIKRGSSMEEVVGGFDLANGVVLEFAREQFGPGKLLEDCQRRLQSGAAIARMVVANVFLKHGKSGSGNA